MYSELLFPPAAGSGGSRGLAFMGMLMDEVGREPAGGEAVHLIPLAEQSPDNRCSHLSVLTMVIIVSPRVRVSALSFVKFWSTLSAGIPGFSRFLALRPGANPITSPVAAAARSTKAATPTTVTVSAAPTRSAPAAVERFQRQRHGRGPRLHRLVVERQRRLFVNSTPPPSASGAVTVAVPGHRLGLRHVPPVGQLPAATTTIRPHRRSPAAAGRSPPAARKPPPRLTAVYKAPPARARSTCPSTRAAGRSAARPRSRPGSRPIASSRPASRPTPAATGSRRAARAAATRALRPRPGIGHLLAHGQRGVAGRQFQPVGIHGRQHPQLHHGRQRVGQHVGAQRLAKRDGDRLEQFFFLRQRLCRRRPRRRRSGCRAGRISDGTQQESQSGSSYAQHTTNYSMLPVSGASGVYSGRPRAGPARQPATRPTFAGYSGDGDYSVYSGDGTDGGKVPACSRRIKVTRSPSTSTRPIPTRLRSRLGQRGQL